MGARERMDEELIDLMVKAGTHHVFYAIESASPRIQELVHKNLDLERAREIVNLTASRRIVTGTFYMLGFPTETEDEMAATVEYAVSLKNHLASFFFLNPFPGTEIAKSASWISEKAKDLDFSKNYSGITLNLSAVPDQVMINMKRSAYRRFYFSPRRISRIVRDIPKTSSLLLYSYIIFRLSFQNYIRR